MVVPESYAEVMLREAHLAAPDALPALFGRIAEALGVTDALVYLVDLQQMELVPFLGPDGADWDEHVEVLRVDSTLPGRSFQHVEVLDQDLADGSRRLWLPVLDGTERLGVLAVTVPAPALAHLDDGSLRSHLSSFASLAAELIMTKSLYGDTIVCLRRRADMGLAAEMQWSLLPPLTFATETVTIAAALEPAYRVAGDSVDYAVDGHCARFAVFDGMGHGLSSARLASLAVAGYRHARRAGRTLIETAAAVDEAVSAVYQGDAFTTAVVAELNTDTGVLCWVNAGHPSPLLLRDGRLVKTLDTVPCLPFGVGDSLGIGFPSVVGREPLQPGDRVALYTDGVVEARAPDGEFFGVQRFIGLIGGHLNSGLPTPEVMRRVVRALLEHQQGQLNDDASMVVVEWRSPHQQRLLP